MQTKLLAQWKELLMRLIEGDLFNKNFNKKNNVNSRKESRKKFSDILEGARSS